MVIRVRSEVVVSHLSCEMNVVRFDIVPTNYRLLQFLLAIYQNEHKYWDRKILGKLCRP